MRKKILLIFILISIMPSILYAGSPDQAIRYFQNKMSEIRGDVPLPLSDPDMPAPKCGTPVTVAINCMKSHGFQLPSSVLETRPDYLPLSFGGTNVLVHYADTGSHAPYEAGIDTLPADGVPDYINRMTEIFEYVIDIETGDLNLGKMGFNLPPADNGRGGDNRYDIYVMNLGAGYYGFTMPEGVAGQYQLSSFIEIENDFSGTFYQNDPITAVKVTAAHEYFHAIQFGYDALEFDYDNVSDPNTYKPWWFEASAVWAEEIVYDSLDDYINYLPYFFGYPWMNLGTFSYDLGDPRAFHPYGSSVWPIFLTEKYAPDIVRQIWERCAAVPGYNTLIAMNNVLAQHSVTLSKSFLEFSVWNYHTDIYANPALCYSEGASFPAVALTGYISQPDSTSYSIGGFSNPPEHLGANYIVVQTGQNSGGLSITFDGDDITGPGWHAAVLGYSAGSSEWLDLAVNPNTGIGAMDWYNWNTYDNIIIIPTVSGVSPYYISYNYDGSVAYDNSLSGENIVYVFPGDLDNNGVVEEQDILPLAAYWSETGNARNGIGYQWSPAATPLWGMPTATYADADGSGSVDIRDFPAILLNWGSLHVGTNLSIPLGGIFDIAPHQDALLKIYNEVRNSTSGPPYFIKLYLEDILDITVPNTFDLGQNFPNPFNSRTSIEYEVSIKSQIQLVIFNLLGQEVKTLIDEIKPAGRFVVEWDGRDRYGRQVASGLYFYRLKTTGDKIVKKMILLK